MIILQCIGVWKYHTVPHKNRSIVQLKCNYQKEKAGFKDPCRPAALLWRHLCASEGKTIPDYSAPVCSPRLVSATVSVPWLYMAVTYACFHKWLSISRRAHMGQASVGQRPLLSQERSSCAGQAGRAGSAVRPEQTNLSEGFLESPTGPSSERKEERTGLRRDSARLLPLLLSQKTFLPCDLLPPRRV